MADSTLKLYSSSKQKRSLRHDGDLHFPETQERSKLQCLIEFKRKLAGEEVESQSQPEEDLVLSSENLASTSSSSEEGAPIEIPSKAGSNSPDPPENEALLEEDKTTSRDSQPDGSLNLDGSQEQAGSYLYQPEEPAYTAESSGTPSGEDHQEQAAASKLEQDLEGELEDVAPPVHIEEDLQDQEPEEGEEPSSPLQYEITHPITSEEDPAGTEAPQSSQNSTTDSILTHSVPELPLVAPEANSTVVQIIPQINLNTTVLAPGGSGSPGTGATGSADLSTPIILIGIMVILIVILSLVLLILKRLGPSEADQRQNLNTGVLDDRDRIMAHPAAVNTEMNLLQEEGPGAQLDEEGRGQGRNQASQLLDSPEALNRRQKIHSIMNSLPRDVLEIIDRELEAGTLNDNEAAVHETIINSLLDQHIQGLNELVDPVELSMRRNRNPAVHQQQRLLQSHPPRNTISVVEPTQISMQLDQPVEVLDGVLGLGPPDYNEEGTMVEMTNSESFQPDLSHRYPLPGDHHPQTTLSRILNDSSELDRLRNLNEVSELFGGPAEEYSGILQDQQLPPQIHGRDHRHCPSGEQDTVVNQRPMALEIIEESESLSRRSNAFEDAPSRQRPRDPLGRDQDDDFEQQIQELSQELSMEPEQPRQQLQLEERPGYRRQDLEPEERQDELPENDLQEPQVDHLEEQHELQEQLNPAESHNQPNHHYQQDQHLALEQQPNLQLPPHLNQPSEAPALEAQVSVGVPLHEQYTVADLWSRPPNFKVYQDISLREIRLRKVEQLAEEYAYDFLKLKQEEDLERDHQIQVYKEMFPKLQFIRIPQPQGPKQLFDYGDQSVILIDIEEAERDLKETRADTNLKLKMKPLIRTPTGQQQKKTRSTAGSISDIQKNRQIRATTDKSCPVCCDEFRSADKVRETQCAHVFHSMCLMMWAKQRLWKSKDELLTPDCPLCKSSLLQKSYISEIDKQEKEHLQLKRQFNRLMNQKRAELAKAREALKEIEGVLIHRKIEQILSERASSSDWGSESEKIDKSILKDLFKDFASRNQSMEQLSMYSSAKQIKIGDYGERKNEISASRRALPLVPNEDSKLKITISPVRKSRNLIEEKKRILMKTEQSLTMRQAESIKDRLQTELSNAFRGGEDLRSDRRADNRDDRLGDRRDHQIEHPIKDHQTEFMKKSRSKDVLMKGGRNQNNLDRIITEGLSFEERLKKSQQNIEQPSTKQEERKVPPPLISTTSPDQFEKKNREITLSQQLSKMQSSKHQEKSPVMQSIKKSLSQKSDLRLSKFQSTAKLQLDRSLDNVRDRVRASEMINKSFTDRSEIKQPSEARNSGGNLSSLNFLGLKQHIKSKAQAGALGAGQGKNLIFTGKPVPQLSLEEENSVNDLFRSNMNPTMKKRSSNLR